MVPIALALTAVGLVACGLWGEEERPVIISGTEVEVTVKASLDSNPGPVAAQHCTRYGRRAALTGADPIGDDISVYYFNCIK